MKRSIFFISLFIIMTLFSSCQDLTNRGFDSFEDWVEDFNLREEQLAHTPYFDIFDQEINREEREGCLQDAWQIKICGVPNGEVSRHSVYPPYLRLNYVTCWLSTPVI